MLLNCSLTMLLECSIFTGSGGLKTKAGKGKKKGFRGGGKKPKGKSAAANLIASMNF